LVGYPHEAPIGVWGVESATEPTTVGLLLEFRAGVDEELCVGEVAVVVVFPSELRKRL